MVEPPLKCRSLLIHLRKGYKSCGVNNAVIPRHRSKVASEYRYLEHCSTTYERRLIAATFLYPRSTATCGTDESEAPPPLPLHRLMWYTDLQSRYPPSLSAILSPHSSRQNPLYLSFSLSIFPFSLLSFTVSLSFHPNFSIKINIASKIRLKDIPRRCSTSSCLNCPPRKKKQKLITGFFLQQ